MVWVLGDFHKWKRLGIALEGLEAGTASKGDITSGICTVTGDEIYGEGGAEVHYGAAAPLEKVACGGNGSGPVIGKV